MDSICFGIPVFTSYCVYSYRKFPYFSTDLFDNLEEDILSFGLPPTTPSNNNIPIILCGDFNSWCGELNDFSTNYLDDENYKFNKEIIENLMMSTHWTNLVLL